MNKLAVIIPFYKREEITSLCFENIKRQSDKYGFDVYTCGSEGEESEKLSNKFGFKYLEFNNSPLSKKNNALIKSTSNELYDGVVIIGSDDFVSDSLFELYLNMEIEQGKVYGFDDVYFYDTSKKRLSHGGEYIHNAITIGVGRLYTREILEKQKYNIWKGSKDNGLDTLASKTIGKNEIKLSIKDNNIFILDVKHEMNITSPSVATKAKTALISEMDVLGGIATKILKLSPSDKIRQIERVKKPVSFVVEFLDDSVYFKKGEKKSLSAKMARDLIKRGIAR